MTSLNEGSLLFTLGRVLLLVTGVGVADLRRLDPGHGTA
jgi:hypothetical protein